MKTNNTPNYDNIRAALNSVGNKLFRIKFTKRSNGEVREMVARQKVRAHLKGGQLNYDPKQHNIITVFEFLTAKNKELGKKAGYKSIPVENILEIQLGGQVFKFD